MRERTSDAHSRTRRAVRAGAVIAASLGMASAWSTPAASAHPVAAVITDSDNTPTVEGTAADELTIVFDEVVAPGTTVGDIVVKRGFTPRYPGFYPPPNHVEDTCSPVASVPGVLVNGDPGGENPAIAFLSAPNDHTLVVRLQNELGADPGGHVVIVGANGVSPASAAGCVHFSAI